MLIMII